MIKTKIIFYILVEKKNILIPSPSTGFFYSCYFHILHLVYPFWHDSCFSFGIKTREPSPKGVNKHVKS